MGLCSFLRCFALHDSCSRFSFCSSFRYTEKNANCPAIGGGSCFACTPGASLWGSGSHFGSVCSKVAPRDGCLELLSPCVWRLEAQTEVSCGIWWISRRCQLMGSDPNGLFGVWLWCYPLALPWDGFVSPCQCLVSKNLGAELGARGCWLLCGAVLGFPRQKGMGGGPGGAEI